MKQEVIEAVGLSPDAQAGRLRRRHGLPCGFIVEPDLDLYRFVYDLATPTTASTRTRCIDELFQKQARAIDPEERKKLLRAFEKRLLDEEAHVFYTLQWHRIIPHSAKVKGWTMTPSHYLNNQLDTVWLAE